MNNLDCYLLKETFKLARKGEGLTSPNPLVGAVLVKDGSIIGIGYHRGKGKPHAEVEAIKNAEENIKGSTLYVSLEPCCHYGRTPPCTDLIIKQGIKRVVAPIKDPNPSVNGKGFDILKKNGIKIETGLLKKDAEELNAFYIKYIKTGTPYIILKAALSLDGRIGDPRRNIFKITEKDSLIEVHKLRNKVDAILIGVETVISDDPELTVRLTEPKHQPFKIIIDPELKTPQDSKIFKTGGKVIIATTKKEGSYGNSETIIWKFKRKNGIIPIRDIIKRAGEFEITSIMVEGESKTFTYFIEEDTVDKYLLFYSPSLIGGGIPLITHINKRKYLKINNIKRMRDDIQIEAENVHRNN